MIFDFFFTPIVPVIAQSEGPGCQKRTKQKGDNAGEDEEESRPKGFFCERVDEREEGGNDEAGSQVGKEGICREVLDGSAEFAGYDGGSCGRRHNKTKHQALREITIAGEQVNADIGSEAEDDLRGEDDTVPTMKAQVEGVDLAEGEEEHPKDEPGKYGGERKEPAIREGTDEHAEPKGVGIKETFDIGYWRLEI